MKKPIYLEVAILELSNLLMCETYYVKLQPYFREKNSQFLHVDFDSSVLSVNTEDVKKDKT